MGPTVAASARLSTRACAGAWAEVELEHRALVSPLGPGAEKDTVRLKVSVDDVFCMEVAAKKTVQAV